MVRPSKHHVLGTPIDGPFPSGLTRTVFGMGCFWGAERLFWEQAGVYTTAVGFAGGETSHPSYREVCGGTTGHAEVVLIVHDEEVIGFSDLLELFWENHDPTQGMRQGGDLGSQYRSIILYSSDDQQAMAKTSRDLYQHRLSSAGYGPITTEVVMLRGFHPARGPHQQYLSKNPEGYCGMEGIGIKCV